MNRRKKQSLFAAICGILLCVSCSAPTPKPYGAVPTEAQLSWQQMEINMFCHFGPNTFTGVEWGSGSESAEVFNPSNLDCCQWVEVAEQAGMKGIIITAKHHDGFCLWPSKYSTHTVAQTTWRGGQGDLLREFVEACRGRVAAGVYISPWDRNHPTYGTLQYNEVFVNTLKEVHQNYGPFFEQWFDGACGEGPNGRKQEYDWPLFNNTVAQLNPNAVIFSDVGPGCRWVGNERGDADETNWSPITIANGARSTDKASCGMQNGAAWIPAEVDVSIRPGWFWHANEHPKSVEELMEIYFNSVGRNGLLLLNVPPDARGLIPAEDSLRLVEFRAERDRIFAHDLAQYAKVRAAHLRGKRYSAHQLLDTAYHTYWASNGDGNDTIYLDFEQSIKFDLLMLQEYIPLGQRVAHFKVEVHDLVNEDPKSCWISWCEGTTIGYKRLLRGKLVEAEHLRIIIDSALAAPILNRIALYNTTR